MLINIPAPPQPVPPRRHVPRGAEWFLCRSHPGEIGLHGWRSGPGHGWAAPGNTVYQKSLTSALPQVSNVCTSTRMIIKPRCYHHRASLFSSTITYLELQKWMLMWSPLSRFANCIGFILGNIFWDYFVYNPNEVISYLGFTWQNRKFEEAGVNTFANHRIFWDGLSIGYSLPVPVFISSNKHIYKNIYQYWC